MAGAVQRNGIDKWDSRTVGGGWGDKWEGLNDFQTLSEIIAGCRVGQL